MQILFGYFTRRFQRVLLHLLFLYLPCSLWYQGTLCNIRDSEFNRTMLWIAIEEHRECMSVLIECGADPDKPEGCFVQQLLGQFCNGLLFVIDEKSGETILHMMSKANQTSTVALLVKVTAHLDPSQPKAASCFK